MERGSARLREPDASTEMACVARCLRCVPWRAQVQAAQLRRKVQVDLEARERAGAPPWLRCREPCCEGAAAALQAAVALQGAARRTYQG